MLGLNKSVQWLICGNNSKRTSIKKLESFPVWFAIPIESPYCDDLTKFAHKQGSPQSYLTVVRETNCDWNC